MELIIPINKEANFHSINQGDETETKQMCSLYAPAINLKYNCGIELTEADLKSIAKKQYSNWLFDYKHWGRWKHWVEAVYQFVIDNAQARWWKIPLLSKFKKHDKEFSEFFEKGYAITVWFWVNSEFPDDARDWKIENHKDYINYKWTRLRHFTNILRWLGRWDDTVRHYDLILDSYAYNKRNDSWLYECDAEEMVEDLLYSSCYVFI